MKSLALLCLALALLPNAAIAQTAEEMRREIEAEYDRLKAEQKPAATERDLFEEARENARRIRAEVDMTPCGQRGVAYVMSQAPARAQLLAPSTARFPSSPVAANFIGNCRWYIIGEVDAQNAFGAMLRTQYTATMEYHKETDRWSAHEVEVKPVR